MKNFLNFRRKSGYVLPFWWPYDDVYCLPRDITTPAHLVVVLVDISCSEERKRFNRQIRPTLGLFSVDFEPVYDHNYSCSYTLCGDNFWREKQISTMVCFRELGNQVGHSCSSWQCKKLKAGLCFSFFARQSRSKLPKKTRKSHNYPLRWTKKSALSFHIAMKNNHVTFCSPTPKNHGAKFWSQKVRLSLQPGRSHR